MKVTKKYLYLVWGNGRSITKTVDVTQLYADLKEASGGKLSEESLLAALLIEFKADFWLDTDSEQEMLDLTFGKDKEEVN